MVDDGWWMLDGLNFQSSELSLPWLSAAGAFFSRNLCFYFLDTCVAPKRDF